MNKYIIITLIIFSMTSFGQENDEDINTENIEDVVVSVSFIPDEKRDTSEISNVLTSEDMTLAGDSAASDALKRITGLSLVKGKYVYVRGMGERYSSALLNGVLLPSPEPLKRVVPFDIFPTSVLESVLVQKTYSAQYPGEFGGGVIDMRTKLIPDSEFAEFGISFAYDSLATNTNAQLMPGFDGDWTGFDDGSRNLPSSLQPFYANGDFVSLSNGSYAELTRAGQNFGGEWAPEETSLNPGLGVNLAYGNSYYRDSGIVGILFSAGYDNDYSFIPDIKRTNYARGSENDLVSRDTYDVQKTNNQIDSNVLASIGWDIDGMNYLQLTNLLVRKTDNRLTLSEGKNVEADFFAKNTKFEWVERQINSLTLSGKHDLSSGLYIDWRYGFADGKRFSPFEREYFYECEESFIENCLDKYEFSRRSDSNSTQFSWLNDDATEVAIDFNYPFQTTSNELELSFGLKQSKKERKTDVKRYRFLPDFVNGSLFASQDFRRQPIENILSAENFRLDRSGLILLEETLNTDNYEGNLTIDAAYLSIETTLNDSLEITAGLRTENSDIEVITQTFFGGANSAISTDKLDKLLPALTATYSFNDSMQLRLGYSETLSRPQFREMSPVLFVNFDTDRLERGFLGLKSSEITNIDLRYEWYFGSGEFFTLSYFRKEFINPIEQVLEAAATSDYVSYRNAKSAELDGIELETQKQLGELIAGYDFFVKFNYTLNESNAVTDPEFVVLSSYDDRPMVGQPENIFNFQFGYYGSNDTRLSLNYNDVGERIRELGTDVIPNVLEDLPPLLDLVYSKEIQAWDGMLDLTVKWRNILEEPYEALQGDKVFESYPSSSSISFSLKYSY
ncbi:MAG: TonB-dependent receptor [Proteobacteria bacterium]|nr:TonB-dependent receptor [SAR86 cluster bacterium]MDA0344562.1 TonB-dependent receptor [Pseudomonadota bacterium]MDA0899668.1 TonB-dependent receptor [Pseudomonadota bacterium]MDA1056316.1 TonB-dependent receptor [Pseudomonadota bacterium]